MLVYLMMAIILILLRSFDYAKGEYYKSHA